MSFKIMYAIIGVPQGIALGLKRLLFLSEY